MPTIGLVANVFQEANALPGWIETHLPFFDDVRVTHAGPQGQYSTDGTIELLEKWKIPIDFDSIDEGFGAVRTRAIHRCPCDYVMILDADERFYNTHRTMVCHGEGTPPADVDLILRDYNFRAKDSIANIPNWENIARLGGNLSVEIGEAYNQGRHLRNLLNDNRPDAVATIRRHWHDLTFRKPTQNWNNIPDFQMRLVRKSASIFFEPTTRMHECLVGSKNSIHADNVWGPFFDHFHFTFKAMEPHQRAHDEEIYDAIHAGRKPPTI
jgi:glycosyltransferase involved in cell wall biosynthesis